MSVYSFKETTVFKKSFLLAMQIFEISKSFPKEEKYSLTDQVRRSSRIVSTNLAEAYRKKRYPAHFISKLTDCDAENSETGIWIEFAFACEYINVEIKQNLISQNEEVGKLLFHMINNPEKY
ncbi:four helix bundle protein [Flavobacterium sp. GT3P67]|uniref:four helix bundle protein n=1 Tax=Flavobacterium sp. GT3P67 TaxID=2541722 RepID=UPI00104EC9F9|nr:four helix bundle protein [Flavobacterium sp. GT3P67]TDE50078.1 four helix bundle protein [Flavobacterium sp. GT3P67]